MTLPVIANTFRCAMEMTNGGSGLPAHTVNVFHVRSSSQDASDIGSIVVAQSNTLEGSMLSICPSDFTVSSVTVTALDGSSGGVVTSGPGGSGQQTGDWVPQGCCVISLSTGARGPQGRGRIYMGPVAEDQQAAGILYGPTATAMRDGWQAFADALVSASCELVVASYVHSVARTVTGIAVHPYLRTQRRRSYP